MFYSPIRILALGLAWWLLAAVIPARAATVSGGVEIPEATKDYLQWTNGMGPWIWASDTFDNQTCKLWKSFEIPAAAAVVKAQLVLSVDDEFSLFLDGRELGRGVDWREVFVFDLTALLAPGKHVLAIRAYNAAIAAGMTMSLKVSLADGRVIEVKSDESWRIVPDSVKHWERRTAAPPDWPAALVEAPLGEGPWGDWPVNAILMPPLQPIRLPFWQTAWFQIFFLTCFGLVALFSLQLMAQLALHRKERWLLQRERTRIAREIHDDIGARMTQLVLQGEVAQCGLPEGSKTQRELGQICEDARHLLATLDEILWAVNPQRDTLRDFESFVCKYAQEFLKPTAIQCLLEVPPDPAPVDFNIAIRRSLLMAIKEALNNVVKYSRATELQLRIKHERQKLTVTIQDNGAGFDPQALEPGRHGITNMHERMNELGGNCTISSRSGQGCRVEFSVPLRQTPPALWWRIPGFERVWKRIRKGRTLATTDPSSDRTRG
jgi:signal transduction histidine kinase